jgi:hypothetical protein
MVVVISCKAKKEIKEMKTCTKCGQEKHESEFNKRSDTKDGLQYYCRECNRATKQKRYLKGQPNHAVRKAARQRNSKHLKMATPPWAEQEGLRWVAEACDRLSQITGRDYHRGHLFPVKGRKVNGLNIPSNIQPELASVNLAHGNKFVPCRYKDGQYYELEKEQWVVKERPTWNPSILDVQILFSSY